MTPYNDTSLITIYSTTGQAAPAMIYDLCQAGAAPRILLYTDNMTRPSILLHPNTSILAPQPMRDSYNIPNGKRLSLIAEPHITAIENIPNFLERIKGETQNV